MASDHHFQHRRGAPFSTASGSTVQPQKLKAAQTEKARLMKVTIKDIQDLAKKYLDADRAARI